MSLLALAARQAFTPLEVMADAIVLIDDGVIRAVGSRNAVTVPRGARHR